MYDYFEKYSKFKDVNGVKTHYYEAGSSKPLVLIHGGGLCVAAAIQWRYNIESLSTDYRVIAPDELGFGLTDHAPNPEYSLRERAEHIASLLNKLNVKAATVCGQSQGAWIATYLTLRYPELVDKLVICNTGSITMQRGRASTAFDFGKPFTWERTKEFYSDIVYNPALITKEMVDLAFEYGKRNFDTRKKDQERNLLNEENRLMNTTYEGKHISEFVSSIKIPMQIVWGANDVVPVERGMWLYQQVTGSQLHVLPKANHLVFMDRYQIFNELVRLFKNE